MKGDNGHALPFRAIAVDYDGTLSDRPTLSTPSSPRTIRSSSEPKARPSLRTSPQPCARRCASFGYVSCDLFRSRAVASCVLSLVLFLYSKSHRRMDVRLPAKYPRETETTAEVTCLNSFRWSCSTLPKNCFTLCGGTTLVVVNDVHALDASGRHRRRERRPRDRGAIPDCPAVAGARHGPRMAEDEQR